MVVKYAIAGRQIGSHYLAMGVLGFFGGLGYWSTSGGAAKKEQLPPLNAKSPDEEKFIKDFLANMEGEKKGDKKEAKH